LNIAALYEEYQDALTRYAISLSRSLDRADDLVQETFVRALQHTSDLEQMNRYQREAWLKRVLRNRFFDEERSRKRKQHLVQRLRSAGARPCTGAEIPDFESLLELVPHEYQDVFVKRYRLGMSSAEISRELGIASGTVRYQLHQCIQILRFQYAQAV